MNTKRWLLFFILLLAMVMGNNILAQNGGVKNDSLIPNQKVDSIDFLSELEAQVIVELNLARTAPDAYVRFLTDFKPYYRDKKIILDEKNYIATEEGVDAVEEAISFLKKIKPLSPLMVSKGLSLAAKDLVLDQGPRGTTGHKGSDGSRPSKRMKRYGKWLGASCENVSYGFKTPRQIIMQLIIDDGVKSRAHRKNLFNPKLKVVGIACGPHRRYYWMCVTDMAAEYKENLKKQKGK